MSKSAADQDEHLSIDYADLKTKGKREGLILLSLCLVGWLSWLFLVDSVMPSTIVKLPSEMCELRFNHPFTKVATTFFPPRATCIDEAAGEESDFVRDYIPLEMSSWLGLLSAMLAAITTLSFSLLIQPSHRSWISRSLHVSGLFCLGTMATAIWPYFSILIVGTILEFFSGLFKFSGHSAARIAELGISSLIVIFLVGWIANVLDASIGPWSVDRKASLRRRAIRSGITGVGILLVFILQKSSLPGSAVWIYPTVMVGLIFASMGAFHWLRRVG